MRGGLRGAVIHCLAWPCESGSGLEEVGSFGVGRPIGGRGVNRWGQWGARVGCECRVWFGPVSRWK